MIFEKIREMLQDVIDGIEVYTVGRLNTEKTNISILQLQRFANELKKINQVEAEYDNDIVYRLAMKYALCLTKFGVDITEKLETATQNAMALEKAYIRGRQDECDRFSEWRDRHKNGWILCSERLPENTSTVLVQVKEIEKATIGWYGNMDNKWILSERDFADLQEFIVLAWQSLPEPYTPKGE